MNAANGLIETTMGLVGGVMSNYRKESHASGHESPNTNYKPAAVALCVGYTARRPAAGQHHYQVTIHATAKGDVMGSRFSPGGERRAGNMAIAVVAGITAFLIATLGLILIGAFTLRTTLGAKRYGELGLPVVVIGLSLLGATGLGILIFRRLRVR